MMDILGNLINGMAFGLGTVIVTTIAIIIGIKRGTKFIMPIVAKILEMWAEIKEGISIDAKVKTKKGKK